MRRARNPGLRTGLRRRCSRRPPTCPLQSGCSCCWCGPSGHAMRPRRTGRPPRTVPGVASAMNSRAASNGRASLMGATAMAAMIAAEVATLTQTFHFSALRSADRGRVVAIRRHAEKRVPRIRHCLAEVRHTLAMLGRYSTVARSVAKFTVAPLTPSTPSQRTLHVVDAGRARHAADTQRYLLGGLALAIAVLRHPVPALRRDWLT